MLTYDLVAVFLSSLRRGLVEKEVESADDVLHLMQKAVQSRRIGETKMNKHFHGGPARPRGKLSIESNE